MPEDPYALSVIAESPVTEYGRALLQAVRDDLALEEEMLRALPCECPEDFRRDFRFRMGMIEKLKQVLALPDDARAILHNQTGKQAFFKGG
jgi:hypothetical protein